MMAVAMQFYGIMGLWVAGLALAIVVQVRWTRRKRRRGPGFPVDDLSKRD